MKFSVLYLALVLSLLSLAVAWQRKCVQLSKFSTKSTTMRSSNDLEHTIVSKQNQLAATAAVFACLSFPSLAVADTADYSAISVARPVIDIFVNTLSLLFICRTVLSWYPKTDLKKLPYSLVAWPTEPLLEPVRSLIPPAFGVDISAIIWIMLLSFLREILTGQQGILTLMERWFEMYAAWSLALGFHLFPCIHLSLQPHTWTFYIDEWFNYAKLEM